MTESLPQMYEAVCPKCGETFNPESPKDLTHYVDMNGNECGGQITEMMAWYRP